MSDTPSQSGTHPSLLLRLRDPRDAAAWQTFVQTYAPLVYADCRRRGAQDADAADITQEVLARVARAMRSFEYRPERGRFRDWLGTVTRHTQARLARRQGPAAPDAAGADPDWQAAPEQDTAWTAAFNAHLLRVSLERVRPEFEPATWRAFERTWLDDRPALEAARELGLAIDKVYAAKSRVLKRLRAEVLMLAEDVPHLVR